MSKVQSPKSKVLLLLLLLLLGGRLPAQTVLGKHPLDQFTAPFWAQNGNANSLVDGLNANGTHKFQGAVLPYRGGIGTTLVTNGDGSITVNATAGGPPDLLNVMSIAGMDNTGTFDDTSLITNAIATTNLYFPPGVYVANSELRIPSNRRVLQAPGARLFAAANRHYTNSTIGTNATFWVNQHAGTATMDSNIWIEGGVLDGNAPGQNYDNSANVQYAGGSGMRFFGVTGLTINNLTLTNMVGFNIQIGAVTNLNSDYTTFLAATNFPHQDCWHLNGPDAHIRIAHAWRNYGWDDMIALNAADDTYGLMSEGFIQDVVLDDIYCAGGNPLNGNGGAAVAVRGGTYGGTAITIKGVRGCFGNNNSPIINFNTELPEYPQSQPFTAITVEDSDTYALPGCPDFFGNSAWITDLSLHDFTHWVNNHDDGFFGWQNQQATTNIQVANGYVFNMGGTNVPAQYVSPFNFPYMTVTNFGFNNVTVVRNYTNTDGGTFTAWGPDSHNAAQTMTFNNVTTIGMKGFYGQNSVTGKVVAHGVDTGSSYNWYYWGVAASAFGGYDHVNGLDDLGPGTNNLAFFNFGGHLDAVTLGAGLSFSGGTLNTAVAYAPLASPTFTGTVTFPAQTSNTVYAGPTSGSAGTPSFRPLNNADFPVALSTFINTNVSYEAAATLSGTNLVVDFTAVAPGGTLYFHPAANFGLVITNPIPGRTVQLRVANTTGNFTWTNVSTVIWPGGQAAMPQLTPGAINDLFAFTYSESTNYGYAVQNLHP